MYVMAKLMEPKAPVLLYGHPCYIIGGEGGRPHRDQYSVGDVDGAAGCMRGDAVV